MFTPASFLNCYWKGVSRVYLGYINNAANPNYLTTLLPITGLCIKRFGAGSCKMSYRWSPTNHWCADTWCPCLPYCSNISLKIAVDMTYRRTWCISWIRSSLDCSGRTLECFQDSCFSPRSRQSLLLWSQILSRICCLPILSTKLHRTCLLTAVIVWYPPTTGPSLLVKSTK